jgi:hypothetical protein
MEFIRLLVLILTRQLFLMPTAQLYVMPYVVDRMGMNQIVAN